MTTNLTTQNPHAAGEAAHTPALRYNGVVPMHAPRALDVGQIAEILSGDGEYWMDVYAPDFKTAQQRAAFIVRACNSHAALVKALNTLDEVRGAIMLAEVEGGSSELAYDVERIVAQARAALEAAKS